MIERFVPVILVGLLAAPAAAQEPATGRFAIAPSDFGFVRMDTRTGRTSHCAKRDETWYCEPISDVGEAVEARVAAFGQALAALEARVDALAVDLAEQRQAIREATAHAEPAPTETSSGTPPDMPADGFVVQVVERFVGMVRSLKLGNDS